MNIAFIISGGNLGNRQANLSAAKNLLIQKAGVIKSVSSLYETEPWGVTGQPNYFNQVIEILTKYSAEALMQTLLQIENTLGRVRHKKYDARTVDLDILFFNDVIINTPMLIIPHPRLHERRFVLEPLNEIAPEFIHPVFKKTVAQLLKECSDPSNVRKI